MSGRKRQPKYRMSKPAKEKLPDPVVSAHDLLTAVGTWVKAKGGVVIVAGGISIQKWPHDPDLTFHVAIRCTGRAPEAPAPISAVTVTKPDDDLPALDTQILEKR